MSFHELPKIKLTKIKLPKIKFFKNKTFGALILIIFLSSVFGFLAGMASGSIFYLEARKILSGLNIDIPENMPIIQKENTSQVTQEEAIVKAVESIRPSVVSIVITKDVSIIEQYFYNPFEGFEFFWKNPFNFKFLNIVKKERKKWKLVEEQDLLFLKTD